MTKNMRENRLKFFLFIPIILILLESCQAIKPKKVDTREVSVKGSERSRKNIEEGKGVSINKLLKRRGGTNFEFSSSNPMWRASLEILDFIPLNTVDYSGGMIVSDWYTGDSTNESIKISIRFLSNEVRSDSLKIIVHKKKCSESQNCKIALLNNSKISQELRGAILKKAAELEKEKKK
tara:strand:+ start:514 stop:1050 length:537 start_codon:yes stop_codon:yes gene_type:complete